MQTLGQIILMIFDWMKNNYIDLGNGISFSFFDFMTFSMIATVAIYFVAEVIGNK